MECVYKGNCLCTYVLHYKVTNAFHSADAIYSVDSSKTVQHSLQNAYKL